MKLNDRWIHGEYAVDLETAYYYVYQEGRGMMKVLEWEEIPESYEDQFCIQEQLVARFWRLRSQKV